MMDRETLIRRLAKAVVDYHKVVKVLQDNYEEARTDLKGLHDKSMMITVERSKRKGRAVTRRQLSTALDCIKRGSN